MSKSLKGASSTCGSEGEMCDIILVNKGSCGPVLCDDPLKASVGLF